MKIKPVFTSTILYFLSAILFSHCSKFDNPATYTPPATDTVFYVESDSDFANPERGFYRVAETYANNYEPLDVEQMKAMANIAKSR